VIRVDRTTVPEPASLSKKLGGSGPFSGMTEAERVASQFASHVATGGDPAEFRFDYKRYKEPDVKRALETLFGGKCAYCESRYAGTQPLDVEHWRPKSEVHERDANGGEVVLPGYHWLASDWENLFPSCIDCNRQRSQHDALTGLDETLGKANQFPVDGPRLTPPVAGAPPGVETPLLLNPCAHDPAEHLDFHDDGTVTPVAGSRLGVESIRVYALNRAELAFDRLGLARLVEQRLRTIEGLSNVVADQGLSEELRRDLKDLLSHEIDALFELAEPNRPYSALARHLIEESSPG
jgi:uncharacterized protein (TIGR02646 family)